MFLIKKRSEWSKEKDNIVSLRHAGTPKRTTSIQGLKNVYNFTLFIPRAKDGGDVNSVFNNFGISNRASL